MTSQVKLLSVLYIFTLISCHSQNNNDAEMESGLWVYETAIINNGEKVDITPFNKTLEKAASARMPWAYSPLGIALKVAGQQMISPEVNLVSKSLSGNELITDVVVIVEKKALPDDSMQDEYHRIRLKLGGSLWQVAEIKHAWRCRKGRGHQTLSAVLCK